MNTQTQEALRMAIEVMERVDMWLRVRDLGGLMPQEIKVIEACKEALESQEQEPVARIEVYNLFTKNGGFAITKEWLWSIRYVNSKGIVNIFPNEYPSEKKYAIQSAKYWADFLSCSIVEVDTRGNANV